MAKVYYDSDADRSAIAGQVIAVIGYGSQGHAQAQNLRDRGLPVIIGIRPGRSAEQARRDGFEVYDVAEATRRADIVHILLPDETQRQVFQQDIAPNLRPGMAVSFSHGFNIHFGQVQPPRDVDVFMVAPKAPGHQFRRRFTEGASVPGLLAVAQDATGSCYQRGLAFAWGIGCTGAGVIETTFQEETESDLLGEQAVLCGGVTALIKSGFETLTEAGYQPEIAFFEVMNEMKMIVDLMYEGGLTWMRYSISDTAEYGDMTRGPQVVDAHVKDNMRKVLRAIQDGSFARDWILENQAGRPTYLARRAEERRHPLETVGRELRAMMPWLGSKNPPDMEEPKAEKAGR